MPEMNCKPLLLPRGPSGPAAFDFRAQAARLRTAWEIFAFHALMSIKPVAAAEGGRAGPNRVSAKTGADETISTPDPSFGDCGAGTSNQ
jgi:hypothetical protein